MEKGMGKIYYAACPECGALTAVEEPGAERPRLQCYGCRYEFVVEKGLLRTLDEIVDEDNGNGRK